MSIKKVVMYVEMDDEEILADDHYKESYDELIEDGYTSDEAMSSTAEDALNLVMDSVFTDEHFICNWSYDVEDIRTEDKESYSYRSLIDNKEE